MLNKKDSFIFRKKYWNQIQKLTANQKVEFMECMFSYQNEGSYKSEDGVVCMLLDIMIDERQDDEEKYQETCERNRNNGKLGGRPPKNHKNPVGLKKPKKPKKADNDNNSITTIITSNKETSISKDIDTKKEEFETFWKEFPHARKGKKEESRKYFNQLNTDEVMKQVQILKRQIKAGIQDGNFIPACERWIRDFTPLNKDVINQSLLKICKRHLTGPGDEQARKERIIELKQTFGEETIKNTIKQLNSLHLNFTN